MSMFANAKVGTVPSRIEITDGLLILDYRITFYRVNAQGVRIGPRETGIVRDLRRGGMVFVELM